VVKLMEGELKFEAKWLGPELYEQIVPLSNNLDMTVEAGERSAAERSVNEDSLWLRICV